METQRSQGVFVYLFVLFYLLNLSLNDLTFIQLPRAKVSGD